MAIFIDAFSDLRKVLDNISYTPSDIYADEALINYITDILLHEEYGDRGFISDNQKLTIHIEMLKKIFKPYKYIHGDLDNFIRKQYVIVNGFAQVAPNDLKDFCSIWATVEAPLPQFDFELTTPILFTAPGQSFIIKAKSTYPEYFSDPSSSFYTINNKFISLFSNSISLSDYVDNVDNDEMKFEFKVNCNIPLKNITYNGNRKLFATPDGSKALTINIDYVAN